MQRREEAAIAFAMWQWSEVWELVHKSLTRLPHNYEVVPPLHTNQTNTKQKKDNLSIILLGGAWTRTALAVEPIPYKTAQTVGRAINHYHIGSTPFT
ncbi:MAG: hypothetical protein IKW47_02915 [Alistipes sp.]|nr:hypothetical protein [Alistipes sp.]